MKKRSNWKFASLILMLSSCSFQSTPNDEQKVEFAMHKMRTDIEELKQDINSNQIELNILEGKILNQDNSLTAIKEKTLDSQQERLEKFQQLIGSIEKKMRQIEYKQEKMLDDIHELTRHANDTTTALSQYKTRISELENLISYQNEQIKEVTSVRTHLSELASDNSFKKYRVQKGDTLKKIAKNANTTLEQLKTINHLPDDRIYVDQELFLPE